MLSAEDSAAATSSQREAQLEKRIEQLERTALTEEIDQYLHGQGPESHKLLLGGLRLRVSGEIRVRQDVRDNDYTPADSTGTSSTEFAHMRTRVRFDIDVTNDVRAVIQLQDVRVLGSEGSTVAITGGVDLKRGFISFEDVGTKGVAIDVGRFVLAYGDQRLVGNLEWFDQGRSYDGVRMRRTHASYWVDAFAVRIRETVTPDDDQWLAGLYGGAGAFDVYLLIFGDSLPAAGELAAGDTLFATIGFRVHQKRGAWDGTAELAVQVGDHRGDDLEALAVAVVGGYTFEESSWRPRVGIEVSFASGDDNPTDGDQGTFQTLFPTNHLHYGRADLVGWSNVLNVKLVVSAQLSKTIKGFLEYHHFRLADEAGPWVNAGGATIRTGAPGASSHLGDEIDAYMTYAPRNGVTILAKYAVFLAGDFVEDTGPAHTTQVFYLQVHVKF